MTTDKPGGTFTFPGTQRTVRRVGYGAMQLAGKGVFGPPRNRGEAVAELRAVVEQGVDHIDTADFYGLHVTNEIIRAALHPYPDHYSIADIAAYPWVAGAMQMMSEPLAEHLADKPAIDRWVKALGERPGVQRGMAVAPPKAD